MKRTALIVLSAALTMTLNVPALAAGWQHNSLGWWYQNGDGSARQSGWFCDADGRYYYIAENGYMLSDTVTPDGFRVGADGAWITEGTSAVSEPAVLPEGETVSLDVNADGTAESVRCDTERSEDGTRISGIRLEIAGTVTHFDLTAHGAASVSVAAGDINAADGCGNIFAELTEPGTAGETAVFAVQGSEVREITFAEGTADFRTVNGGGSFSHIAPLGFSIEGKTPALLITDRISGDRITDETHRIGTRGTENGRNTFTAGFSFALSRQIMVYNDRALTEESDTAGAGKRLEVTELSLDEVPGENIRSAYVTFGGGEGWMDFGDSALGSCTASFAKQESE